ncbi:hypothetical protein [Streptomyces sp. NPDC005181]|uniref:hypothetical protein n=1 Tax=Streptomyces sp. NPDC005181 TaxID=3156869 RepID=UPI0033A5219E
MGRRTGNNDRADDEPPFVGRDAEVALLNAVPGPSAPRAVALTGEPGIVPDPGRSGGPAGVRVSAEDRHGNTVGSAPPGPSRSGDPALTAGHDGATVPARGRWHRHVGTLFRSG